MRRGQEFLQMKTHMSRLTEHETADLLGEGRFLTIKDSNWAQEGVTSGNFSFTPVRLHIYIFRTTLASSVILTTFRD